MKRIKMLAAGTVGALALSVGGVAGTASAQSPVDDVPILIQNLPAAVEQFLDQLQTAIDDATATTPPSVAELADGIVQAFANSVVTLGNGTSQFGALGIGAALAVFGLQQALIPVLEAIDDPSLIAGLVTADDLSIIVSNLPEVFDVLGSNLTTALEEGAKGNLFAPGFLDPLSGTPSLLGNVLAAVGGGLFTSGPVAELVEGTNSLSGLGIPVAVATVVAGGAVGALAGEYLLPLEDAVQDLLAGL